MTDYDVLASSVAMVLALCNTPEVFCGVIHNKRIGQLSLLIWSISLTALFHLYWR